MVGLLVMSAKANVVLPAIAVVPDVPICSVVTTPVLPSTLVTASVGVARSVKSAIDPAEPPLCIYVLFSSDLTTTSPSSAVSANCADSLDAVWTVVSAVAAILPTGNIPVTCDARSILPVKLEVAPSKASVIP